MLKTAILVGKGIPNAEPDFSANGVIPPPCWKSVVPKKVAELCYKSKHLKGQFESFGVFWSIGGQSGPPVSRVTLFGPKEVSWSPFKLSAGGEKREVENTPKCTRLKSIYV